MFINTARVPWISMRTPVTTDDTAITDFKRGNWPSSNIIKLKDPPLHDANGLIICGYGTNANNEALTSYKVLGVGRQGGPIFTLLTGVWTLGALTCTVDPITQASLSLGFWVDTMTVTGGLFSGIVEILDSTNDRICGLRFDQTFIDEIYLELDLNTCASMGAIICGY